MAAQSDAHNLTASRTHHVICPLQKHLKACRSVLRHCAHKQGIKPGSIELIHDRPRDIRALRRPRRHLERLSDGLIQLARRPREVERLECRQCAQYEDGLWAVSLRISKTPPPARLRNEICCSPLLRVDVNSVSMYCDLSEELMEKS